MELLTDARKRVGPLVPTVFAIGNFDGVHRGHLRILEKASALARDLGARFSVLLFDPHPSEWFRPAERPAFLSTGAEKRSLLASAGVELLVEQAFDSEFSALTKESFLEDFLKDRLAVRGIVVGDGFAFGKDRAGNADFLQAWAKRSSVEVRILPTFEEGAERVSSSRIREALARGETETAEQLLGRPFSYSGEVSSGDARGSRIGFPTANIKIPPRKLIVPYGVYATLLRVGGQEFPSVTNIGVRPTFGGDARPRVETHALDAELSVRGLFAEVFLKRRLRAERRFSGADELIRQIRLDADEARALLRH